VGLPPGATPAGSALKTSQPLLERFHFQWL
jgi:hypothetical protein